MKTKAPPRAAGVVVFRRTARGIYYLVLRAYNNWDFPKGLVEAGEEQLACAKRELREETGLSDLSIRGAIETIDWFFRFRGQLIHKVCHFFLMQTAASETAPQRAEGITACKWTGFDDALALISYSNARDVLRRAQEMVTESLASA